MTKLNRSASARSATVARPPASQNVIIPAKIISAASAIAKHPNGKHRGMNEVHGKRVDFALRTISRFVIGFDTAIDSAREARVDLHRSYDQRRIYWSEEAARGRRLTRAIDLVEHAVAEDTVVYDVVRDCEIEGLVKIAKPFRRAQQNRGRQRYKYQQEQNDPGNAEDKFASHAVGSCHRLAGPPSRAPAANSFAV